jgi:hypothetical protein
MTMAPARASGLVPAPAKRPVPLRHFKILPTKSAGAAPWLLAWGYSVRCTQRSGRETVRFQPETFVSEHGTRREAECAMHRLAGEPARRSA